MAAALLTASPDAVPSPTTTARKKRLTDKTIERLRPPAGGRLQIPDSIITGLWLRVTASGVKSWSVLYRMPGRKAPQRLTLGKHPGITCGAARKLAREVLIEVAAGRDPAAAKRSRRYQNGDSFEQVAEEWLARQVRGRLRSGAAVASLVRRKLIRPWAGRRIGSITKPDVLRLLDAEMDASHERSANKLLGAMRRLFRWSIERGYLTADPTTGLRPPGRSAARERVLTDDELVAVWRACEVLGWPWGPIVQLLILTAQRRNEVAGMAWSEIDLARRLWTLPAARSKSARQHELPLSQPGRAILGQLPRFAGSDLVFPARSGRAVSSFSGAKAQLDQRAGVTGWTFHDLRRTTVSGMARLGVQPYILAAVLNHAPAGVQGVTSIYNRHRYAAEMRTALDLWAGRVLALAAGGGAEVLSIKATG